MAIGAPLQNLGTWQHAHSYSRRSPPPILFGSLQSAASAALASLHHLLAASAGQVCLTWPFIRQLLATQGRTWLFPHKTWGRYPPVANSCLTKGQAGQILSASGARRWLRSAGAFLLAAPQDGSRAAKGTEMGGEIGRWRDLKMRHLPRLRTRRDHTQNSLDWSGYSLNNPQFSVNDGSQEQWDFCY